MLIASWVGRLCNRCTRISLFFFPQRYTAWSWKSSLLKTETLYLSNNLIHLEGNLNPECQWWKVHAMFVNWKWKSVCVEICLQMSFSFQYPEQLSSQKKHHAKQLQEMETSHQREVRTNILWSNASILVSLFSFIDPTKCWKLRE